MTPALRFLSTAITTASPDDASGSLFIAGVFLNGGKPRLTPSAAEFDEARGGTLTRMIECGAFDAKAGSTLFLGETEAFPNGFAVLGLGEEKDFSRKVFAECAAKAARAFAWAESQAYAVQEWLPPKTSGKSSARLFSTAVLNALTPRFTLKTEHDDGIRTKRIFWIDDLVTDKLVQGLDEGVVTAEAMSISRGLADLPGNVCTPAYLAEAVQNAAAGMTTVEVEVLDEHQIEELGMGAFLSVAKGSTVPPRFIAIRYRGTNAALPPVAFVGKGITFDTGGISLKPAANMADMTYDMSGAAVVIGTVMAAARAKLPVNLLGVVAACENLPSGSAAKPGDVVTSLSGKTIEILNTDCEGRMILADALTWTARQKPELIIDAATLTGACCVALGAPYSGLFTSDDALAHDLIKAGRDSLDDVWRLPIGAEYAKLMKTPAADIANQATVRDGGASSAAAFLSVFAEDVRWARGDGQHVGQRQAFDGAPRADAHALPSQEDALIAAPRELLISHNDRHAEDRLSLQRPRPAPLRLSRRPNRLPTRAHACRLDGGRAQAPRA